jgi:CHAT domain-containing protein
LGRTLFIKGLLHSYLSIWKTEHKIEAVELFRKAMNAYGINPSNFGLTQLNPIPNKEDVLMCMKYYTLGLLELDLLNSINNSYLLEAKKVNAAAIKVWEQIHYSFKGKNINQNLAIYNLIPQQEQLAILMRKKKSESDDVKEIFLQANEKLKYYDLFKGKQLSKNRTTTMEGIQKNLRSNQLLMDFHFSPSNQEIYVLQITKDKSKIIIVNGNILKTATEFKAAIVDMNYEGYIKTAYELYNKLFPSGLKNINELIICPDAFFGDFPFEALLCSTNNIEQKDYRKLDYLMNKTAVQYVLTPSMFTNKEHKTEWRLSVFAPSFNTDKFAELPFSQKMGKSLVEELSAISYNGTKATKKALQHIKSSIVHLSTHAVIGDDATNNFIQLTNGAFYQNEINGLNHIPNLVVLNACNSGKGKQLIGDGINGFVRELHKTGVNATLSNLWEVDDKISNELLLLFYKELYAEKNATYALRYAKLNTINSAANSNLAAPYYWAGHQLIGGELVFEVESEKEDKIVLYWLLLLFAFITGIWFFLSNKKYS